MFNVTSILSFCSLPPNKDVLATSSIPVSPSTVLRGWGVAKAVPSGTCDVDVDSAARPAPQPSEGQRLSSLDRPPLVPTTLINCHLTRQGDQLFRRRPGQADSGRGVELPALLLLAGNLYPSSVAGKQANAGFDLLPQRSQQWSCLKESHHDPGEVTRKCMREDGWN